MSISRHIGIPSPGIHGFITAMDGNLGSVCLPAGPASSASAREGTKTRMRCGSSPSFNLVWTGREVPAARDGRLPKPDAGTEAQPAVPRLHVRQQPGFGRLAGRRQSHGPVLFGPRRQEGQSEPPRAGLAATHEEEGGQPHEVPACRESSAERPERNSRRRYPSCPGTDPWIRRTVPRHDPPDQRVEVPLRIDRIMDHMIGNRRRSHRPIDDQTCFVSSGVVCRRLQGGPAALALPGPDRRQQGREFVQEIGAGCFVDQRQVDQRDIKWCSSGQ